MEFLICLLKMLSGRERKRKNIRGRIFRVHKILCIAYTRHMNSPGDSVAYWIIQPCFGSIQLLSQLTRILLLLLYVCVYICIVDGIALMSLDCVRNTPLFVVSAVDFNAKLPHTIQSSKQRTTHTKNHTLDTHTETQTHKRHPLQTTVLFTYHFQTNANKW